MLHLFKTIKKNNSNLNKHKRNYYNLSEILSKINFVNSSEEQLSSIKTIVNHIKENKLSHHEATITTYRGDRRKPIQTLVSGLAPTGTSEEIVKHVRCGSTKYISTSTMYLIAEGWARHKEGYVYFTNLPRYFIDITKLNFVNSSKIKNYQEYEMSSIGTIPSSDIKSFINYNSKETKGPHNFNTSYQQSYKNPNYHCRNFSFELTTMCFWEHIKFFEHGFNSLLNSPQIRGLTYTEAEDINTFIEELPNKIKNGKHQILINAIPKNVTKNHAIKLYQEIFYQINAGKKEVIKVEKQDKKLK